MVSNDVLAMYEQLATLTGAMASAAQAGERERFAALEDQCAAQVAQAHTGVPALAGAARMRKIDLLKQIMANDRAIRAVTDPFELSDIMAAAH